MSEHLAPREADRLRRAESRWLEQARERLRGTAPSTRPARTAPATRAVQATRSENATAEETDR